MPCHASAMLCPCPSSPLAMPLFSLPSSCLLSFSCQVCLSSFLCISQVVRQAFFSPLPPSASCLLIFDRDALGKKMSPLLLAMPAMIFKAPFLPSPFMPASQLIDDAFPAMPCHDAALRLPFPPHHAMLLLFINDIVLKRI